MEKKINILKSRIQHRCDTTQNWIACNPVLLKGEMGIESDTRRFKFGDSVTPWNDLAYAGGPTGIGGRNLLLNSGIEVQSNDYNFANYNLSERIYDGQEVTLTIWGVIDDSVNRIEPYNSGGMVSLLAESESVKLAQDIKQTGKWSATFKWRSDNNLFHYSQTAFYVNTSKIDEYAYKQTTADNNAFLKWKVQGVTVDDEYIGLSDYNYLSDIGRHSMYFTVPANKELKYIRFGLNGSQIDTLIAVPATLSPGVYTLSFDLDNNIQGEIKFSHIKILPGRNNDIDWKASLVDLGTVVTNTKLFLYSMNAGYNEQNLTTKIIRRIKLEYGNVSTDWSPAPEDATAGGESLPSKVVTLDFEQSYDKWIPDELLDDVLSASMLVAKNFGYGRIDTILFSRTVVDSTMNLKDPTFCAPPIYEKDVYGNTNIFYPTLSFLSDSPNYLMYMMNRCSLGVL